MDSSKSSFDTATDKNGNLVDTKNTPLKWEKFYDPSSKKFYYVNLETKESTWNPPPELV